MLKILVTPTELYDNETNTFTNTEEFEVELEHSLLSLSKWEAKHQKPFLAAGKMTDDEILDYVMCMCLTESVTREMVKGGSDQIFREVNEYINSSQSATTFGEMPEKRGRGEVITSELIYYWLVAFTIPFECETWHLNRLFSLIRICNMKNSKPKKVAPGEAARQRKELNDKRKAEWGTSG